uniref:CHAP domain-containing protein n=1 Tax=Paractinoplanes polyasparticus TaxID=2856853 RepID=UPI001C854F40|nr:CHAP domain-containing protein [Actinoplanes polyasparticus]
MRHPRTSALRRRFIAGAVCCAVATAVPVTVGASTASAATNDYRTVSVTADGSGYVLTNTRGGTYAFGAVRYRGNPVGFSGDIVGVSTTADGSGYAAISSKGQVYAYGSVAYRGNPAGFAGDIVGISVTANGSGYAAISSTGQVYAYGSVQYRGNPVGYSGRIAGISATADGSGYAAISSTGQVYAYGTVRYRGNPTGFTGQIVGVSATADGSGYAAVSSIGQVYAYGTVVHRGNPAGFTGGIAGISVTGNGSGYAAVSGTGQIYAYGTVAYRGNADPGSPSGGSDLRATIVAKARAEAGNPARNREIGGPNCNYYTPADRGTACSNGWRAQAWCADFARWIWSQSGARTNGLNSLANSIQNTGTWRSGKDLNGVQPGDLVGWKFGGSTSDDHVGVVVTVNGNSITTIDGNYGNAVKTHPFTRGTSDISGYATPAR